MFKDTVVIILVQDQENHQVKPWFFWLHLLILLVLVLGHVLVLVGVKEMRVGVE